MIDTQNGGMAELFVTGKSEPLAIPIPDQQIMLGRDSTRSLPLSQSLALSSSFLLLQS